MLHSALKLNTNTIVTSILQIPNVPKNTSKTKKFIRQKMKKKFL